VHPALCGVLHPEGESVSPGPQELARLERRTVLKLCAASLSAAALGTGLGSCASGPDKRSEVVFKEVTRAQLNTAAGEIARILLGFLEQGTSNAMALQQMDRVLREVGVRESALAGPVAPGNQVGYSVIFHGGELGFITLKVYNDSKFVLPLIVRRGVATDRSLALTRAARCCMTAGTSTYTTAGALAITDAPADDPCPGAGYVDMRELSQQRRNLFSLQDVVAYTAVIRKCIEVLETEGDADVAALQAWLAAQQPHFTLDKAFLSARRDGEVLWVDWMLIFRNGAVGMAQVAKGEVKPVYSTARPGKGASPLTRANIDTTPAETNVEGIDIAFPRVSLRQ
jgi:hypothetical protein